MKITFRPFRNHTRLYYVVTELGAAGIVGRERDGTWRGTGLGLPRKPAQEGQRRLTGTIDLPGYRTRQKAAQALVSATAESLASRPGRRGDR